MAKQAAAVDWLLAGDPAVRWQALRDLKRTAAGTVRQEQERVAREGWGARLLALQDDDGGWGGGLYTPKWTSTTYTLLLLRSFGLPPGNSRALRGARLLLDEGFWRDGGINFYPLQRMFSETCISSMVLSVCSWFGVDDARVDTVAQHVMHHMMADRGWNCRAMPGYGGATHSSFHTTILALEGLLDYERTGRVHCGAAREAQRCGREFFLAHRLYRSHRTGAVVKPAFTHFAFPPRWHFDVLRGLDYFRDCGAAADDLLRDAIEVVRSRQRPDGRWARGPQYPGKTFFDLEAAGEASRWNTLRALRVLRWWERRASGCATADARLPRPDTIPPDP